MTTTAYLTSASTSWLPSTPRCKGCSFSQDMVRVLLSGEDSLVSDIGIEPPQDMYVDPQLTEVGQRSPAPPQDDGSSSVSPITIALISTGLAALVIFSLLVAMRRGGVSTATSKGTVKHRSRSRSTGSPGSSTGAASSETAESRYMSGMSLGSGHIGPVGPSTISAVSSNPWRRATQQDSEIELGGTLKPGAARDIRRSQEAKGQGQGQAR